MSRLDDINSIDKMVDKIYRRIEEAKESQIVGGDSVKTFFHAAPSTFSGSSSSTTAKLVRILFTPSKSTVTAFDIKFKITSGIWNSMNNNIIERINRTDNISEWQICIPAYGNDFTAQAYVMATGKGTVSVVL